VLQDPEEEGYRSKMRKIGIVLSLILTFLVGINAQGIDDIVRFSYLNETGTSRSLGVGGSLSALGADFSVISNNPAGIGMFRGSELSFSPTFSFSGIETRLTNESENFPENSNSRKFLMSNFGMVFASQPRDVSKFKTFNFGLGFNQLVNFNERFTFSGLSKGSIVDRYQFLANTFGSGNFEAGMAIDASALYDFNNDDIFDSDMELAPNALIRKSGVIETGGSINEFTIGFGTNYDERIIIGATIGVPFAQFRSTKTYIEEDPGSGTDGNVQFFENLELRDNLSTNGIGINLKVGAIFRVSQELRFGFAMHTPTSFNLEDTYRQTLEYTYLENNQKNSSTGETPDGLFSYKIQNPWRAQFSAGYLFGKSGFLTAEAEFVDYSAARFRFEAFKDDERQSNDEIKDVMKAVLNLKLGGEYALKSLRLRGGISFLPSFFENDQNNVLGIHTGFGYRFSTFYIDAGYRYQSQNQRYLPYFVDFEGVELSVVEKNTNRHRMMITIGSRF